MDLNIVQVLLAWSYTHRTRILLLAVVVLLYSIVHSTALDLVASGGRSTVTDAYVFPELLVPIHYFPEANIVGGSGGDLDDRRTWSYAMIGIDTYQSFPTTTIALRQSDFSNGVRELPRTSTKEHYLSLSEGQHFLPGEYDDASWLIEDVHLIDLNGDQDPETVVYMSEGLDHVAERILVVKNNKIIFSINGTRDTASTIIPSETGNGFYLQWTDLARHFEGTSYCCPKGYMKTRFVFENGLYVPVYEQEVLYFYAKDPAVI